MSKFVKGEMKTDGQDAIRVGDTKVAHMCSNFDWTVRRATANEIVRRWNAFEKDGLVDKLVEALGHYIDDDECSFDHHGCCQTHGGDPCREVIALAAIAKVS